MNPIKKAVAAAIIFAAVAAPAGAMTIDEESIKTADDCVSAKISFMAYDIAFTGGGTIDLDQDELKAMVTACEIEKNDKSQIYRGMTRYKQTVPSL